MTARARPRSGRLLALAAAGLFGTACGGAPAGPRPPDVAVILVDTLRSDRLSCYGYERPTSPRLDRLAAEGVLFTDVTSQATWTLPSVVSILQGRYLTDYRDRPLEEHATLAELFSRAGYRTVGLVANQGVTASAGFDRGFDVFESRARDLPQLEQDLWAALEGLGDERTRPPLFLYLQAMDPHMPYLPHPELDAEIPPEGAPPPMPRPWQEQVFAARGPAGPERDPQWSRRWDLINSARGRYDQGVRYTDDGLGRIFDGLAARALSANAVVAVLSDHGEVLWERVTPSDPAVVDLLPPDEFFYREHGGHLTQETLATPLILWGAGVPAGVRFEGAVENIDLAPTLLALCGLPLPTGERDALHGRNLIERLAPDSAQPPYVFTFNHAALAVREVASGLKLILPVPEHARYEVGVQLYHLPSDPEERRDLHAERPGDVARLSAALAAWSERFPTTSNFGQPIDPETEAALRELGYTEVDIGR